jgi:hypothetical protein
MNEDGSLPVHQQYRKTKNSSHNEKKSLSQNRIEKNGQKWLKFWIGKKSFLK